VSPGSENDLLLITYWSLIALLVQQTTHFVQGIAKKTMHKLTRYPKADSWDLWFVALWLIC